MSSLIDLTKTIQNLNQWSRDYKIQNITFHGRIIFFIFIFQKMSFYVLDALLTNFIIVPDFSHQRFLQINLQNGSIVKLPIIATAPGIAFDKVTKTLFYSAIQKKTIMSTTLHGENSSLIYTIGNI